MSAFQNINQFSVIYKMTGKAIDSIQRNKQVLKRINLKKIRGREKSIFTSELNKSKLRLIIKKKVQKSSSTPSLHWKKILIKQDKWTRSHFKKFFMNKYINSSSSFKSVMLDEKLIYKVRCRCKI